MRKRASKYAKAKKLNAKIEEKPYTKKQYAKKYTLICAYCGEKYQSTVPAWRGISYCSTEHKLADYNKRKLSDN